MHLFLGLPFQVNDFTQRSLRMQQGTEPLQLARRLWCKIAAQTSGASVTVQVLLKQMSLGAKSSFGSSHP
jgi:hypothetical protein